MFGSSPGAADEFELELNEGTELVSSDVPFDGSNEVRVLGSCYGALEGTRDGIINGLALGVSLGIPMVKRLALTKASFSALRMVKFLDFHLEL